MLKRIIVLITAGLILTACQPAEPTGTLEIRANGEDFVREGFISKDGWSISFDQVNVHLADVAAYLTDPPYDASTGAQPAGLLAELDGSFVIDLAAGSESADPILIGTADVPVGQFNAVSWKMNPAENGQTIEMVGSANKDGETIDFVINSDREYGYACGEFVGDERKGFVTEDGTAEVELTFHFDHVFGDIDTPADDALNTGAIGFSPLAQLATSGSLNVTFDDLAEQLSADDFAKFEKTMQTLGHVGEGHCFESSGGYTGEK